MDARADIPPTVILVDDDTALLRALQFSLELEGFAVEAHRRGSTVRPADLPASGACLVLDYFLPGPNGLDVLRRLRNSGVTLPAVLITSHAPEMMRHAAASLGATVVEKPLLGPELVAEIRTRLDPNALHQETPQMTIAALRGLSRIDMELAREPGHPHGDPSERYTILAPLTDDSRLDARAFKDLREHCRVTHERGGATTVGRLEHGPGGRWLIVYAGDASAAEACFRFGDEAFRAGEYVSIRRGDETHVYRITASYPL